MNLDKLFSDALPLLKGHREGIVVVLMLAAGIGMFTAGVNALFAFGLPVAMYLLYHFRMNGDARHKERMAEIAVQRVEATKGLPARAKAQKAIARRKKV